MATELELLEWAKGYIDRMAQGVHPIEGTAVGEGDTLNDIRVARCLIYVADVLDKLIQKGGLSAMSGGKQAFRADAIDKGQVKISATPIQISTFVSRINKQAYAQGMKGVGATRINAWLVAQGYLDEHSTIVRKEVKEFSPTERASEIGLVQEQELDRVTGEYQRRILLTKETQQYLLEQLASIAATEGDEE